MNPYMFKYFDKKVKDEMKSLKKRHSYQKITLVNLLTNNKSLSVGIFAFLEGSLQVFSD